VNNLRIKLRWQFIGAIALFTVGVMSAVVVAIQRNQGALLEKEITERGLTIARTLAATCVEPMELPERTLATMLLVKEVIQQSSNPEALKTLYGSASMTRLMAENLNLFRKKLEAVKVSNEGVLFARVVGADGKVVAVADTIKPQEQWFDEIEKAYSMVAPIQTTPLVSGTSESVSESPDINGIYVIAVPIIKQAAADPLGGMPAEAASPSSTTLADSAPNYTFLGAVYLGVSKGLVRRAVAHSISRVVIIAVVILVIGIGVGFLIANYFVNPIHDLHNAVNAVSSGNFDVRVSTKHHDEMGALGTSFNEMASGLAEKELIGSAFGAYVSKDILAEILKNPDAMKVGGSRKSITMVCSDVRGFTAMSEKLTPEQVVHVVNQYLDVEARLVAEYGGYLDRFVGDAVRAVWGVPVTKPDDAVRAVRCALAIKAAVIELQKKLAGEGLPSPKVGVGIDSGHVVAGNLGAPGIKLDYTVVGEPVQMSEKLVDVARDPNANGAQLVLSERTLALVEGKFELKELDRLEMAGKEPLRVFEVLAEAGAAGKAA
jgi:class 3 adenylate cyclase